MTNQTIPTLQKYITVLSNLYGICPIQLLTSLFTRDFPNETTNNQNDLITSLQTLVQKSPTVSIKENYIIHNSEEIIMCTVNGTFVESELPILSKKWELVDKGRYKCWTYDGDNYFDNNHYTHILFFHSIKSNFFVNFFLSL